jgi:hypothetical protein
MVGHPRIPSGVHRGGSALKTILLLAAAMITTAKPVRADDQVWGEFALHRKAPTTKAATICGTYSPLAQPIPCYEYTSTAPAHGYSLVYLVIGWGPTAGVSAASFGIDYDGRTGMRNGLDPSLSSFTPCFDGAAVFYDGGLGDFPAPKGGAFVTWNTCANTVIEPAGVHALIGALSCYAYAEDVLRITPNTVRSAAPELVVIDCHGTQLDLAQLSWPFQLWWVLGRVQFGGDGSQGYPGCGLPIDTRPATWGRIKGLYHAP